MRLTHVFIGMMVRYGMSGQHRTGPAGTLQSRFAAASLSTAQCSSVTFLDVGLG